MAAKSVDVQIEESTSANRQTGGRPPFRSADDRAAARQAAPLFRAMGDRSAVILDLIPELLGRATTEAMAGCPPYV
ncbi:hypothetical protein FIU86_01975 [Roseovarius sp. THAF9]|nr:hypothetical protein FIU86_01975 [Roseovarius sp. THAF9]